ncbi:alpha/beta hydrolase [Streptomyces sp. NPDC050625]|uniref:alpha/beta fold hydrolase n=1 Tax=Streptomyces sp. NPDC050625 TaxID=3154629 RepID=UPI003417EC8A
MSDQRTVWRELLDQGFSQKFYDVDGVRTRAIEAGDGPAMIWLHGGGGHAETYVRNLGPYSPYRRSYSLDMLGHGFTDTPADLDYTTSDVVEHVVRFMDAAGIEKADLSGESFGGRVATWVAIKYPERVNKLILNTSGGLPASEDEKHQGDLDALLVRTKASLEKTDFDSVRARMEWLVYEPASMPDEMVRIRQAIYERPGIKNALTKLFSKLFDPADAVNYWLTPERLVGVKAPTQVVWTRHNPIHSWEDARAGFAHIPDVRFHLIEDAAHWPHFEQADEYNDVTLKFLLED